LANPGFEKDESGWATTPDVVWTTVDADGCPFSGSMRSPSNEGTPAQTPTIKPGVTYNFGASFSAYQSNAFYLCEVYIGTGDPAITAGANVTGTIASPGHWETKMVTVTAPADAIGGAIVDCEITGAFVDKIFLTPTPGAY
jgi:hypothetical protein